MLVIRLILILLVITAMVLLGLYMVSNDRKYLDYFKRVLKYTIYLAFVVAVLFVLRYII
jgi:hypothetical protein